MNFQFRAAEDRLLALSRSGKPVPPGVFLLMVRLGRAEARYDEVRIWMRAGFEQADQPIAVLRQLWLLDRGVIPIEGLREDLERALALCPNDDRVWLGLGRVATLEGRFDVANRWLRRCMNQRSDDRALDRAWLDWALASGHTDEVARILAGPLGNELEPADRFASYAWLAERSGSDNDQRRALECWLEQEPYNPMALERLGTLAARAQDVARSAGLRLRKARVDEAIARYRRRITSQEHFASLADRVAMAQLAEEAGRPFDAGAWCTLAARLDPSSQEIARIRDRLNRAQLIGRGEVADCDQSGLVSRTPRATTVKSDSATPPARLEFRDDALTAGLHFKFDNGETALQQIPETMSGGVGLLDYDCDGWLDVYCVQGGSFPPDPARPSGGDRLFHNRRDGTFEDVSESTGIAGFPRGYGHGVAVGDYDNDGRPDLFVTRWRAYALYRNRGDGTFQDVTTTAGLGGDRDWPTSAAFADLDGDGDLDLYVCHYLKWDALNPKICRDPETQAYTSCSPLAFPALPDHVFRNDGGHFVDVTATSGIADQEGRGLGVVAADLDSDGKVDLFVTNDQSANYLFRNQGGFHFAEMGCEAGVAANAGGGYQAGMGVACGDVDGDGRPDLAVTNFYGESTSLFQNLGAGRFNDRTTASGLAMPSRHLLGFGASFLDADNDGYLDLLTANGHLSQLPGTSYKMPVQLLLGNGGRFHDVTANAGQAMMVPRIGRGLAIGDMDNDGRIDAVVIDHKAPLVYLHNRTEGGSHFVVFRLEGTRSPRDATGVRVVVTAGGKRRFGWRLGGGSYQSASDARLHFGLGQAKGIETIEVAWPSGLVQQFGSLAADRGYLLREGEPAARPLPGFSR